MTNPAIGRDKSLHYMVGSKNGHVGQGFSPAEPPASDFWPLALQPSTFFILQLMPFKLGVPNSLPNLSVDVRTLNPELSHSYCFSLFPSGNHQP